MLSFRLTVHVQEVLPASGLCCPRGALCPPVRALVSESGSKQKEALKLGYFGLHSNMENVEIWVSRLVTHTPLQPVRVCTCALAVACWVVKVQAPQKWVTGQEFATGGWKALLASHRGNLRRFRVCLCLVLFFFFFKLMFVVKILSKVNVEMYSPSLLLLT